MTKVTYLRNTKAFDECYLVPRVLRSVEKINLETKIMGRMLSLSFFSVTNSSSKIISS